MRRYKWRRNTLLQQSRLDFFLISDLLSTFVTNADIKVGYRTDHSMITLTLTLGKESRNKLLWKSNNSLLKCEQVLFVYVSTLIPPCLTDQRNFIYCTISNPGTGADDTFVLKRGVWRNAAWPSHSRPAIAASARHFQICFSPLTF